MKGLNSREIVIAGKRFLFPFQLSLTECEDSLECVELLRFVPGKRAVVLGQWRGKKIVAKFFFKPFRSGQHVKRELKGNRLLKKNEIATPDILYSGSVWEVKTKVLVFNYIHPAESLGEALASCKDFNLYREYLQQLITLLGTMHNAGLQHNDLHLNNFLVSSNKGSKGSTMYALDGDATEKKSSSHFLDINKSMKNLSMIFVQLNIRDDNLFRDLVNTYFITRKFKIEKKMVLRLEKLIKRDKRVNLNRYLKKIYRSSTDNICEKSLRSFMLCKRNCYTPEMKAFLKNLDIAFNVPEKQLLKAGNSSTVARFNVDGKKLVVKRYNMKNFFHALRRAFKKSRADRSWHNAHLLLKKGIATPAPVALKEKRFGFFRNKAYFICEYIEGTSARNYFTEPQSAKQNILPKKIIEMFKLFESSMISHGDMKATNIIIKGEKPFLIDLDGMKIHKNRSFFARAHRKDIKRFMKNFAHQPEVFYLFSTLQKFKH